MISMHVNPKACPTSGVMVGINASLFVIKVAANIGTHSFHPTLRGNNSVLTEETFKAGKCTGRLRELTQYHCAQVMKNILAGSSAVCQPETSLARS
jgi:hypothetical protein